MTTLLSLYFWILPLQWALSPMAGIDLALSRVFALGIIVIWAAQSLARRSIILPRPAALLAFASFLLISTLSYAWAENRDWALRKIIFLWNFIPLFIVFIATLREQTTRTAVIRAIVGGSVLASLIGIAQFLSQFIWGVERAFAFWTGSILPFFLGGAAGESVANYPSLLVNISGATILRASALFPDPHMLSLYLGLSLPLAIMLALTYPVGARRLPLTACFLILLADLLTFSRGGYLGVVVGIFILFFLISIGRLSQTTLKRALISGAFALLMGLTLFLTPFGTRLISIFSSDDGSNIERLRLWQEAVSHIADRPFLGTGIGNYPLLVKPTAEYREPIYIHNLFLDIASETGLPGLTAFLGLLGTAFVSAFTAWRKYQDHLGAAVFIALSIFSTHAFFELPLYSVQVLPFFLLIAALAITSTRDHHGSDSHPNTL